MTALLTLSVAGAMAALAVGTFAAAAGLWWLSGPASWSVPGRSRDLLADLARACSAIAGVIVLSNVDLLLARHFLSPAESGAYALAALFGKACLWGAQFVPALVFPRLARDGSGRGLLLRSAAAAGGVGVAGILVAAVAAGPVVRAIAGDDPGYAEAVALAVPFAVLGTLWALVQLALLAAVAGGDPRPGRLLWVVVAVEALIVTVGPHDSPAAILAVGLVCTSVLAVAATLLVLRDRHPDRFARPGPARLTARRCAGHYTVPVTRPGRPGTVRDDFGTTRFASGTSPGNRCSARQTSEVAGPRACTCSSRRQRTSPAIVRAAPGGRR